MQFGKIHTNIRKAVQFTRISALGLFLIFSIGIIFPLYIERGRVEAMVGDSAESSIEVNFINATASLELEGEFRISSDEDNIEFEVITDNYTGYRLYLSSSDDSRRLSMDENNYFNAIDNIITEADFRNSNYYNGKWGYRPNYYGGTNNNLFLPAPTTEAEEIDNSSETERTYSIAVGARIDQNKTVGLYQAGFNVVALTNPADYYIYYDENADGDYVESMPETQFGETNSTYIYLDNTTPYRDHHEFIGWCTERSWDDDCQGDLYQPGDWFGIDKVELNEITLYATWRADSVSYDIYYYENANGDEVWNMPDSRSGETVEYIYIDDSYPSRDMYDFGGWCDEPTEYDYCPGQTYWPGDSISVYEVGDYIELYAIWWEMPMPMEYYITYDGNGSDDGYMYESYAYDAECIPLTKNAYTKNGYYFMYWYDTYSESTYSDGEYVCPDADMYLQAVWGKSVDQYINYDGNDEDAGSIAGIVVQTGDCVELSDNAYVKNGYYFKGWYDTYSDVTYRANETVCVYDDMYLEAIWEESANTKLYDAVASLNKGNYNTVFHTINKETSGVYRYDANRFGVSSDASNDYPIYIYRGILDYEIGDYGIDGDSNNYSNYIMLDNGTCWRIIRTTGSGGTKAIYSGMINPETGDCSNSDIGVAAFYSQFNDDNDSYNIGSVGYTYNDDIFGNLTETTLGVALGSNSNMSVNDTDSVIKSKIEEWYENAGMTSYTAMLEPDAGICNNRSVIDMDESELIVPYSGTGEGTTLTFGSVKAQSSPTLNCARGAIDIYTTSDAVTGNHQLKYPVGLISEDETAFAGTGTSFGQSNYFYYNTHSYLNSNEMFWTISPTQNSAGGTTDLYCPKEYNNSACSADITAMVRPVISFKNSVIISGGSGTMYNPWTIVEE